MYHVDRHQIIVVSAIAALGLPWVPLVSAEPTGASSESASVQSVSLAHLIDEACQRSPGLQAKKRQYEAARARAVTSWLPDDPEFGVDVEGQPDLFNVHKRTDNEYTLLQRIPFPTTLWLNAQVASREAQMAYQQYKEEERQTVWHMEQPYAELFLAKQTVKALDDVKTLNQKLIKTAQARYESNQASQQDLLKAQIELAKVGIDLVDWKEKAHLAEAHLSHVLNQSLELNYELAEEPKIPFPSMTRQGLEQLALHQRPELKAMAVGVKRAKTERALAWTSWLPEVTGRIESRQFKGESHLRENDTFIGVTVPVWSLLKGAGGQWKAAAKDVQAAEALYDEMKNEVLLAVHEAYSKAKAAEYAVKTYETLVLPQAKQQVEVSLASYEAGRADFLSLIDAQRTFRDTQIAYYRVKADYELAMADLRLAVGGSWSEEGQH